MKVMSLQSFRLSRSGGPVVGKQLGETGNGVSGDAGKDIMEPEEWIDAHALASSHEAAQHGGGLAALVAPEKDPVVTTMDLFR
jgi:hypothetical protein